MLATAGTREAKSVSPPLSPSGRVLCSQQGEANTVADVLGEGRTRLGGETPASPHLLTPHRYHSSSQVRGGGMNPSNSSGMGGPPKESSQRWSHQDCD